MYITKLYKKLISEIPQLSNDELLEEYTGKSIDIAVDFCSNSENKYLEELTLEISRRMNNE